MFLHQDTSLMQNLSGFMHAIHAEPDNTNLVSSRLDPQSSTAQHTQSV